MDEREIMGTISARNSIGGDDVDNTLSTGKAQGPQTVIVDDIPKDDTWFGIWFGRCPNCKEMLTKKYHKHFCGNCGQAVKWNG